MQFIKRLYYWLAKSSADSREWSMTAKAFIPTFVSALAIVGGLAHIHVPGPEIWSQSIDAIVALLQAVVFVVSAFATVVGLIRKIFTTVDGTNEVVNNHPAFQM